jgi:hypothetical protein
MICLLPAAVLPRSFWHHITSMTECDSFRWPKPSAQSRSARSKFTPDEDRQLRTLVEQFGEDSWSAIAEAIEGRTPRQCKERWTNYLCPELNSATWSETEDLLLLQKHREMGARWVAMAKFFPKRTDSMLKNRFNCLRRRCRKQGMVLRERDHMPPMPILGPQPWTDSATGTQQALGPSLSPLPVHRDDPLRVDEREDDGEFMLWSDGCERTIDSSLEYRFEFI